LNSLRSKTRFVPVEHDGVHKLVDVIAKWNFGLTKKRFNLLRELEAGAVMPAWAFEQPAVAVARLLAPEIIKRLPAMYLDAAIIKFAPAMGDKWCGRFSPYMDCTIFSGCRPNVPGDVTFWWKV
jgi:hypothetical protein